MIEDESLEDLLKAAADGDEAAFARLYAATSPRLFAVVRRIVVRREWAEEVLQEVYITLWDRAGDYRPDKGAPMTWISTIGRNRALDRCRRERRRPPLESDDAWEAVADPDPSPLDWALAGAEARRLQRCLDLLNEGPRACIMMAVCEGYTHEELAERLGSPIGTVKSWIRRGLKRLKDCLER